MSRRFVPIPTGRCAGRWGGRQSYRVAKEGKRRNWANRSRLPVETQKLCRTSVKGQKLVPLEALQVEEPLDNWGVRGREKVSRRWGLAETLGGEPARTRSGGSIKRSLLGRIFSSSRCALQEKPGGRVLGELCGVRAKNLGEEGLCRARDG
ncbi:hypothetical protein [Candidatus Methylacidithermus pantelleriae]|uniref:Uncharacterized protein n=1 Tax=Candidatus Methylacidithermus pantelleriae TaxID=2744239 RepID=A0A8J2BQI4_9BACT|nr:hypothetical protein [Candidatus Methylacidithermus pantelleriae]CAF0689797.1 hypothetical protein MPNT_10372 [Candidatus Methylacidithermus pantelleriae]